MTKNFFAACRKCGAYDCTEEQMREFVKVFIRKFTNARLGGYVKAEGDRMAEQKGCRGKGGANLRDRLYNTTGQQTKKESMKRAKGGIAKS